MDKSGIDAATWLCSRRLGHVQEEALSRGGGAMGAALGGAGARA